MNPSLDSVWAKVHHAKEHRDALNRYISETFADEANQPVVGARFEPESGEYVKYISRMPDLERFLLEVGLRVGDTIHNLRCALDHLVVQLALLRKGTLTPKEARQLQFPITDTPEKFAERRGRYLRRVAPAQRTIIEQFQPYDTRTSTGLPDAYAGPWIHPLRLLRELSNEDKRRVIVAVLDPGSYRAGGRTGTGAFADLMAIADRMEGGTSIPAQRLELGTVVERGQVRGDVRPLDAEVDSHMTPAVCLSENRPVIEALDRIAAFVIHVIHELEPLFQRATS